MVRGFGTCSAAGLPASRSTASVSTPRSTSTAKFFPSWVPKIRAYADAAGVKDFEIFGEVFVSDAIELSSYSAGTAAFRTCSTSRSRTLSSATPGERRGEGDPGAARRRRLLPCPSGRCRRPGPSSGTTTSGASGRLIKDQSGASGPELVRRVNLAHALLYLLRGAPIVYYGDEVGIIGLGGDKEARQDMFPTQVPSWQTEERVGSPPIGTGSSFDVVGNPVGRGAGARRASRQATRRSRRAARSCARGEGLLVVSRFDPATGGVLASSTRARGGSRPSGLRRRRPVDGAESSRLSGRGRSEQFERSGLDRDRRCSTPVLLRADSELPRRGTARVTLRTAADLFTNYLRLTATSILGRNTLSVHVRGAPVRRQGMDSVSRSTTVRRTVRS